MNENWYEILDILAAVYDTDLRRESLITAVENCFRVLGWKKSDKSMQRNFHISSGRILDLVLCEHNSSASSLPLLPVIVDTTSNELTIKEKVKHIMQDLNLGVVLAFTKGVYLYFSDSNLPNPQCVCKFILEQDNEKGILFFDLLSIDKISKQGLLNFCKNIRPAINEEETLLYLLRTPIKIKQIVKEYVLGLGFDANVVEKNIENIHYQIAFSKEQTIKSNVKVITNEFKRNVPTQHDTTKYSFDGINFYSKKRFVLNVIKRYVEEHKDVTYSELEQIFPSKIISKKRGVIRPLSLVKEWIQQNPDLERRYCISPSEIITLRDGLQLVVYNQWGNQFHLFLDIAKKFYTITSSCQKTSPVTSNTEELLSNGIHISEQSLEDFTLRK